MLVDILELDGSEGGAFWASVTVGTLFMIGKKTYEIVSLDEERRIISYKRA